MERSELHGAAVEWVDEDARHDGGEYQVLVNAVLELRYPQVTFCVQNEMNVLVKGNNYDDVTEQVDYEAVWTMTAEQLQAELDMEGRGEA